MALTDWTEQFGGGSIAVSGDNPQSGSKALGIDGSDEDAAITNDQSEADAPVDGRVVTQLDGDLSTGQNDREMCGPGIFFRYIDSDNYYWFGLWNDRTNANNFKIRLVRTVGGAFTTVQNAGASGWDGSQYNKARFTFWSDGGTTFVRLEQEQSGSFTQIGSDLSDAQNEHTEGGGIGLGKLVSTFDQVVRGGDWDETELFY